jgi:RNA polymerase sigma-70 factor, ECF subfamily
MLYEVNGALVIRWKQAFWSNSTNSLSARRVSSCKPRENAMMVSSIVAALLFITVLDDEESIIQLDAHRLVAQAQAGHKEALSTLYRMYSKPMFRYVVRRVPRKEDAEDITAEVFARMVRGLRTYKITGAPFEAWLYRIAAFTIADFYRAEHGVIEEELSEVIASEDFSPEDLFQDDGDVQSVHAALKRLSEEHVTILILRFVERKTHEEVASILGKSVTAVKSAQHRALTQLSELLGNDHKAKHYLRGSHE